MSTSLIFPLYERETEHIDDLPECSVPGCILSAPYRCLKCPQECMPDFCISHGPEHAKRIHGWGHDGKG